ncbi:DUF4366 domain-containing protein [Roseburia sp. AM23-20]|jgi:hypothetical protein|uniref:CD1107 family mobile element protein n=1 Tax=Roseburia sp. AM23-20 TaxID=2292066 RepID=UPI000E4CE7EA|nr:DUF4366 domain-containing protein [Roseburia sp. AM23-20]RHF91509.1 DUF4366 domain-containing protein [Roseburia sp. AM23-20]
MKKKLSIKVVLSLVLSAVLFTMPIGAFVANQGNVVDVHAQDMAETVGSAGETTASDSEGKKTENPNSTETQESTSSTEESSNSTEESTGSTEKNTEESTKPECTCEDKCTQYEYDKDCEVCKNDYRECAYVTPSIKITVRTPSGWHKDTTKVSVKVEDTRKSGNFAIQKVQAKIAQNGSWMDITEDMYVEISENSTIYVQVTDQKGKTYERNRYIQCFDFNKPTLNAAVSDGLLSVQAQDTESGIKAVYVNGYEFKDLTNGVLNIRLQQFDAGYQYFTIQAMDNAGNMSEVYKTANPYYTDPENTDSNEKNPAEQLPSDAQATKPSSATAQVTEHTKTDSDGNTTSQTSAADAKKQAMAQAVSEQKSQSSDTDSKKSGQGKEFYTIQTASEKVFYLIIDRDGEEEKVYFLTEVSENDLLNITSDTSETLPKNSAALESAIPVTDAALSNNNTGEQTDNQEDQTEEETENTEETKEPEEKPVKKENSTMTYLVFGGFAVVAIGAGYYFKVVRKKKEQFLDEDDEEDEEEEVFEDDEDENDSEDDFFAEDDSEEDE